MHEINEQGGRRGLGAAAMELAMLTYAAFETLAERRYAAPWQVPARRTTRAR